MSDLISQPSASPTRKVSAVGITGAVTVAIIAGVNALWPGVGDQAAPVIAAAVTWLAAFLGGYLTRERA